MITFLTSNSLSSSSSVLSLIIIIISVNSEQQQELMVLSKWYTYHSHQYAYINPPPSIITKSGSIVNMMMKGTDDYLFVIHPNEAGLLQESGTLVAENAAVVNSSQQQRRITHLHKWDR